MRNDGKNHIMYKTSIIAHHTIYNNLITFIKINGDRGSVEIDEKLHDQIIFIIGPTVMQIPGVNFEFEYLHDNLKKKISKLSGVSHILESGQDLR